MRVTAARGHDEATVHTMNTGPGREPVYYASSACEPASDEMHPGQGTNREEAKHSLISNLLDYRAATKNPPDKQWQSSGRTATPIRLERGPLGKPFLILGERRGPAITFSEGGGNLWAALCGEESDIGIDVARSDEFRRDYPVQRVFHPEELEHASRLTGGDRDKASALLWSIKEAFVKALGCAFHLVDPLQIAVQQALESTVGVDDWHHFPVNLTGKAGIRFPKASGRFQCVHSLPQQGMWLSIALVNRGMTDHE